MTDQNPEENQPIEGQEITEEISENNEDAPAEKNPNAGEVTVEIEDEMKSSYLDYAMSVIVSRALPDVKDGLKPVHRRILYSMNAMGLTYGKPFKKSARIVGEVLGKYHPHGDSAVYESMVRMAQPFSLRYPLIFGQGNFGSVDGDSAAAMRYTEAKLAKVSDLMLKDINKDTVDFAPNFDASLKEPVVLPTVLPNLLLNGSSGIAVGMATNIPPHNLTEVVDAVCATIDNPDIEIDELITHVQAPDFPTGAYICGRSGILSAYKTGKGRLVLRAVHSIEEGKTRRRIVFTEIPYQLNKSNLLQEIAQAINDKKILGVSDLRDESDRKGIRVVLDLKRDANPEVTLNQLYKHSRLQMSFGINMLALVDNQPKLLNLKEIISLFIAHRKDVVTRRVAFDLKKAKDEAHILEGLVIALEHVDEIIAKIKASSDATVAKSTLVADYSLSELQAQAILDMKLQRLSSLEQQKIRDQLKSLKDLIGELTEILNDVSKIYAIIKEELVALKDQFGDERRTQLLNDESFSEDVDMEDLIKEENVVITISNKGYIKRTSPDNYKLQHRGGSGVIGATTHDDDWIEDVFITTTHSYLLCITNKGKMYWLKGYKVPEGSRTSKGKPIINLVNLDKEEVITTVIPLKEFDKDKYLVFMTKNGIIKKTSLDLYSRPRSSGLIAITIDDNDSVVNAIISEGRDELMIVTNKGYALRCNENDVRPMGRSARGVKGISLRNEDYVINLICVNHDQTLLTLTENGYGKRTKFDEYRLVSRGSKGVININVTEKNGNVVSSKGVSDLDEILLISQKGQIIKTLIKDVPTIGRNTQGVRVMRLKDEDSLVSAALIKVDADAE